MSQAPSGELLAAAARLAKADPPDRWALGDLAVRAVPGPAAGAARDEKSRAQASLYEFASAADVSFSLLKDCWYTSLAWPVGTRFPDVSHAKHSRYRSRKDRVSLLLNEEMDDNLGSSRVRERVHKVEELLADKEVRDAVLTRSKERTRRVLSAAKAMENEELTKARVQAKLQEQDMRARLAEPEHLARLAERFIKANVALARMTMELLDLSTVVGQVPEEYKSRTIENLEQISGAAIRVLDELRPQPQSPQPRTIIDLRVDDQPGEEH